LFCSNDRFYADLVGYWEHTSYVTFVHSDSTHFVERLKYAIIYIVYIAIVPYLLFKAVKTITLATLNKKDKSDVDIEG